MSLSFLKPGKKPIDGVSPAGRVMPGLRIDTADGRRAINGLALSYSQCSVYCLNKEPELNDRIELDHTDGLAPGDLVLITNAMYGGSSRSAFQCMVTLHTVEDHEVSFSPPLPKHIMRFTKSLFVLKRAPSQTIAAGPCTVIEERSDAAIIEAEFANDDLSCTLTLTLRNDSPRIDVQATSVFKRDVQLFNLSLVFDSALPLSSAFLKNRVVRDLKDEPLKRDLWLWKEGCAAIKGATKGSAGWSVLHNPEIASCEIVTRGVGFPFKTIEPRREPSFVINLEHYNAQHFRLHKEFIINTWSTFDEHSLPSFKSGERAEHRFSMHVGDELGAQPRLMLAPGGHRAVNVWTEHADKTTIESHRASYFGHETITSADDAIGGFVKHGHVVTKSVFCENPLGYQIALMRDGQVIRTGSTLAMEESPEFVELLDQLHDRGHEICVHAIRPDSEKGGKPDGLPEKIDAVYERYKGHTWIDHALEKVEFCAGFRGLLPEDEWSMLDAWKKNDIRYFWTWSSADFMPKGKDMIDLLHNDGDGAMPTPLYWRHPMLPEGCVVWGANECHLDYFSDQVIDQLVLDRGVSVQQHYYPFITCELHSFGFIDRDENGHYTTTEQFDAMLAHMSGLRDQGELCLTTVGKILDYWIALEGITHTLLPDGRFELVNTSDEPVNGLSFVVSAGSVRTNDVLIQQRTIDRGDVLVWFDMPARGRMIFETTPIA
tara:strand:+ start:62607 stop:64751 length:2145 start_codon:yes stop_codon:yes gene_type:complete